MSGNTWDLECPCGHEFEGPAWGSGYCPKCNRYWGADEDAGGNPSVEWDEPEVTP